MMIKLLKIIVLISLFSKYAYCKQSEAEISFLNKIFNDNIPKKQRLIVKGKEKDNLKIIMGNKYKKRQHVLPHRGRDAADRVTAFLSPHTQLPRPISEDI